MIKITPKELHDLWWNIFHTNIFIEYEYKQKEVQNYYETVYKLDLLDDKIISQYFPEVITENKLEEFKNGLKKFYYKEYNQNFKEYLK